MQAYYAVVMESGAVTGCRAEASSCIECMEDVQALQKAVEKKMADEDGKSHHVVVLNWIPLAE